MSVAQVDGGSSRITRFLSVIFLIPLVCALWSLPASAQLGASAAGSPAVVYVGNGGGGITEINTANNSVIATAPFPNNANGVVVSPDGRRIYASNRDVGQVTVFDVATNVPIKVIPVGNGNDNLGLAISPDGTLVYVANQFSGTVSLELSLWSRRPQTQLCRRSLQASNPSGSPFRRMGLVLTFQTKSAEPSALFQLPQAL